MALPVGGWRALGRCRWRMPRGWPNGRPVAPAVGDPCHGPSLPGRKASSLHLRQAEVVVKAIQLKLLQVLPQLHRLPEIKTGALHGGHLPWAGRTAVSAAHSHGSKHLRCWPLRRVEIPRFGELRVLSCFKLFVILISLWCPASSKLALWPL